MFVRIEAAGLCEKRSARRFDRVSDAVQRLGSVGAVAHDGQKLDKQGTNGGSYMAQSVGELGFVRQGVGTGGGERLKSDGVQDRTCKRVDYKPVGGEKVHS